MRIHHFLFAALIIATATSTFADSSAIATEGRPPVTQLLEYLNGNEVPALAETCFLNGERVDQMSKLCYYQCTCGTKVLNLKSHEVCPVTASFNCF